MTEFSPRPSQRSVLPAAARVVALLVASTLAACAGAPTVGQPRDEAERLYLEGLQQLRGGNPLEATQSFANLLKLPAYLGVTATARIRLGDALFAQGKYTEAIEAYQGYLQRHEGSSDVAYAAFKVAECHARMVPTDFWLLPPVHEMDLSAADKARYHLERFVRQHPTSNYVPEALRMRDEMLDLELSQHRYVVRFYRKRSQWLGVAWRSHEMMRRFPLRAHGRDDYVALAQAYEQLGWRKRARDLNRTIARRWPQDAGAAAAREAATRIDAEMGRLRTAGDKNAEMPAESPPTAAFVPEELAGSAS
ncbi:MAG: hypothetical protein RIT45_1082 [Pseudomonadota bacterium]